MSILVKFAKSLRIAILKNIEGTTAPACPFFFEYNFNTFSTTLETSNVPFLFLSLNINLWIRLDCCLGSDEMLNKSGQKQPPEVFPKKRCSKKFCKIQKKTPLLESLF